MTDREKAIVMAYTGVCMLEGDKFQVFHKYVEEIMGRPILTHEIGLLADEIKENAKADFLALCADEEKTIVANDVLDKIRAEILEEKGCAYADFERYKVEYLGQSCQEAYDSLPDDDFRYGMERAIEIIDKYRGEREEKSCRSQTAII